jgi:hypothetical protein
MKTCVTAALLSIFLLGHASAREIGRAVSSILSDHVALAATDVAEQALTPNLYQFVGHQLRITYSTSSIRGTPLFTYRDGSRTLQFEGTEIRTIDTELGTLVTVTTRLTTDAGWTTFTLLLPRVHLGSTQQAAVETVGLTTDHLITFTPAPRPGQTERYRVTRLTGTAELVDF